MDHAAPFAFQAQDSPTTPLTAPTSLARAATGLRPVINATGVLLHAGLGRAPLSAAARAAIDLAAGTTDLELDLSTGRRGRRGRTALAALAAAVPSAAGVHIVNNNAAGLLLAVTALAGGREIVVSRGELVETADGFRLPELLVSTGARLREVGTTNRTTLGDYADAIGPRTGLVLRVHPSSYQVVGLTDAPSIVDLAALCADFGIPLIADCGSGLLHPEPLLRGEPDVSTWLAGGVDLVTTSGDRLLGGPQCGLLLGRADLIDRMRRHPMARGLRAGKLTLAALEATLSHPDSPIRQSLRTRPDELTARAETLAAWLRRSGIAASAVASRAVVDGGGGPAFGASSHHGLAGVPSGLRYPAPSFSGPAYPDRVHADAPHPGSAAVYPGSAAARPARARGPGAYDPSIHRAHRGREGSGRPTRTTAFADAVLENLDDSVRSTPGQGPTPGPTPGPATRSGDSHRDRDRSGSGDGTSTGSWAISGPRGFGGYGPELPSAAVALDAVIAAPLRHGEPAVLGRVEQGCCLLDLRTVPVELDPVLAAAVLAAATEAGATTATDAPTEPHTAAEADVVTIESTAIPRGGPGRRTQ